MATSASRSRLFPARSRKSYRLEMESRTLYLLLSLMVLTGCVVFYLGVVTGKALRDPNAPMALATQMGNPATPGAPAADKPALAFSEALKGDQRAVEGLREEGQTTAERTEALLSEGQKQLKLEEVTPSRPTAVRVPQASTPPQVSAPRVSQPQAGAPAQPSNPADDGALYTVQVFSSQSQERARELMNRLINQGFPAYLNRYEAADKQVWYRVRVGKLDRSGADSLQSRLRSEAKLKNPQVQKL